MLEICMEQHFFDEYLLDGPPFECAVLIKVIDSDQDDRRSYYLLRPDLLDRLQVFLTFGMIVPLKHILASLRTAKIHQLTIDLDPEESSLTVTVNAENG